MHSYQQYLLSLGHDPRVFDLHFLYSDRYIPLNQIKDPGIFTVFPVAWAVVTISLITLRTEGMEIMISSTSYCSTI